MRGLKKIVESTVPPREFKRVCTVDTLSEVRRLEAQGVETKEAVALSYALNDNLESIKKAYATKADFELESHICMSERDFANRRKEMQHLRSELLSLQHLELCKLTDKLNKEVHGATLKMEVTKYELAKYVTGSIASLTALGFTVYRLFFM
ncbi:hypothetical protein L1987_07653 [Smallanthus sonchifolius]|uniref:Uncharacterized protein n=1 Tax=Smallanthus sonchifolius TaxID=185202 RepID=A0ACB9K0S6_9ASTR|nr:hypothetical protein L1987_07653 [Smallanthus sonchifolius]